MKATIHKDPQRLTAVSTTPLFDRSKWETLPFGAFADCISERAHPTDFADAIYVGLEHLDPENLHIRRWGKGSDVEGVKLRFYKGDIIFGRRRAYQRKLAVAEVDGICSAHAMVLRANPELCLPEFLPFLMMSDAFMKRAVEISVGSLSPTISWGVLKQQRFALPPLDQQRRIAELLWAVDESMVRYKDLQNRIDGFYEVYRDELVNGRIGSSSEAILTALPDGWESRTVGEVVKLIGGSQPPRDTFEYQEKDDNIRLIQVQDYKSDERAVYIKKDVARRHCNKDDVMIGRYGPPVFQIYRGLEGSYNVALIKALPLDGLQKGYLYHFMKQKPLFELIDHLSQRSSGQTGVDMDALRSYPFPLPSIEEQTRLTLELDNLNSLSKLIETHIESTRRMCLSIINAAS